jgi:hypothetical protein
VALTGLTGVGQWTLGLVFRCVLGSEGCVLVPRFSGTPVATWAWPTWVVSRRRVLEAVFTLLEFQSTSRRIFIGSHSLPPLWFVVSVLHLALGGRRSAVPRNLDTGTTPTPTKPTNRTLVDPRPLPCSPPAGLRRTLAGFEAGPPPSAPVTQLQGATSF